MIMILCYFTEFNLSHGLKSSMNSLGRREHDPSEMNVSHDEMSEKGKSHDEHVTSTLRK
jgi:hypothetical protein